VASAVVVALWSPVEEEEELELGEVVVELGGEVDPNHLALAKASMDGGFLSDFADKLKLRSCSVINRVIHIIIYTLCSPFC
tara:strand:- start:223 stop:465 length:243 start_codon:yes stop_codon:yes gene_type:complete